MFAELGWPGWLARPQSLPWRKQQRRLSSVCRRWRAMMRGNLTYPRLLHSTGDGSGHRNGDNNLLWRALPAPPDHLFASGVACNECAASSETLSFVCRFRPTMTFSPAAASARSFTSMQQAMATTSVRLLPAEQSQQLPSVQRRRMARRKQLRQAHSLVDYTSGTWARQHLRPPPKMLSHQPA